MIEDSHQLVADFAVASSTLSSTNATIDDPSQFIGQIINSTCPIILQFIPGYSIPLPLTDPFFGTLQILLFAVTQSIKTALKNYVQVSRNPSLVEEGEIKKENLLLTIG